MTLDSERLMEKVYEYLETEKQITDLEQRTADIYIKPWENRAYIVIDGEEQGAIVLTEAT